MKIYINGTLAGALPYNANILSGIGYIYNNSNKLAELIFLKNSRVAIKVFDNSGILKAKLLFIENRIKSAYCIDDNSIRRELSKKDIDDYTTIYNIILNRELFNPNFHKEISSKSLQQKLCK